MKDNVIYVTPATLLDATSKNASFNSAQLPVNQNIGASIQMSTISSSALNASAVIQGSLDGSIWVSLDGTTATILSDDDILWTINEINSLIYLRVAVTISAGSAIFTIIGRAV